jgi:hypothetical protein
MMSLSDSSILSKYYVQSLYAVINSSVKTYQYTCYVELIVPSRLHILWLLASNKTLIRYNLAKR